MGTTLPLPLDGISILSAEQYGAGPFGSMLLADLGAEVIKIENPHDGGDVSRATGPFFLGDDKTQPDSQFFQSFNRNKKSLTLDLKTAAGQTVFRKLAATSHAVMNNLRGDLPVKLGLTHALLKDINPALVCVHDCHWYGDHGLVLLESDLNSGVYYLRIDNLTSIQEQKPKDIVKLREEEREADRLKQEAERKENEKTELSTP